jgi:hypothetical protein
MGDTLEDLKVPKDRVSVELALRGGGRRQVQLFLAEHEAHAFRHESLVDLLEDARRFLPAFAVDEDVWLCFHKDAIGWLAVARPASEELELFEEDRRVDIRLRDGSAIAGELLYSPPQGGSRLVDHLNAPARYLRVYDAGRVYFVDKAFIESVRERDSEDP